MIAPKSRIFLLPMNQHNYANQDVQIYFNFYLILYLVTNTNSPMRKDESTDQ